MGVVKEKHNKNNGEGFMKGVENLDSHVREALRNKILSGSLSSGYHLSELQISKEYNVSRTPVREALCALAADGLIEMVPNRGAFVREITPATMQDQHHVYGHLIALAARMATERVDIETLLAYENAMGGLDGSGDTFADSFGELNRLIRQSAGSASLEDLIETMEKRMPALVLPETMEASKRAEIQQAYAYILTAFKRRKPDVAEKTMRQLMMSLFPGNPHEKAAPITESAESPVARA